MEEDGMTRLMQETLEEGLARLEGRPVRLRELHREPFPNASSWPAERLRVRVGGGGWLGMFFKDLNPQHHLGVARPVPQTDLKSPHRELLMYREVLGRQRLGTPRLYAFRWDPPRDLFWLFLEDAGSVGLNNTGDFALWVAAARWAARFHAATRDLPPAQTHFLRPYDRVHFMRCAERVRQKLPDLKTADRPIIQRALDEYAGHVDWFSTLPRSVIHGEFFGKNIVIREGSPGEDLAVIDWESAAVGPSYFDVASLSAGKWQAPQKEVLWRAYFDQYQLETGLRLDWEGFCQDLGRLTRYQALSWLGWRPDWNYPHGITRWVRELEQALPG
jgi:hypothetical protein